MRTKHLMQRILNESGQTVVFVALAMGTFLLGAIGLAIDGAHIYAQFQMAQSAADAAAQGGIMSIFDGTNSRAGNPAAFTASTGTAFTCGASDARTPCAFARLNGFNLANDVVTVSFPPDSTVPGVNFSGSDPTNLIQVTVQRRVDTTLMHMLGSAFSTVRASAMAAIVDVVAPTPILIAHPTLPDSFSTNGGPDVIICGGPQRSIQVNSGPGPAIATALSSNTTIDLSKAGPADDGHCHTGTGTDFGSFGGPSRAGFNFLGGSTGHYLQPASPIDDPLKDVPAPNPATLPQATAPTTIGPGVNGCPVGELKQCYLFTPGIYPTGLTGKNEAVVFSPGIYYIQNGGVTCTANCDMYMATSGTPDTITNTGWTDNILIYNSGSGPINIGANGNVGMPGAPLIGSPEASIYKSILFFEDHTSPANTGKNANSMGGGGALELQGTVYLTNSKATMLADATHYQQLHLQGNPGSATQIQGRIIVDALDMGGTAGIEMDLISTSDQLIREVALVK